MRILAPMFQLPRLPPRFDVALRDVRSTRAEFRLEAAAALAFAGSDEERAAAREALRPLLDDPIARIRAAALTTLGEVGTAEDVPALLRATRDERPALREAATVALGRLGIAESREALRGLLASPFGEVRYQAVESLAADADASATDAIAARLRDEDAYVREAAASALAVLGAEPHRDELARCLGDASEVALAAASALASAGDARAVPRLRADVRSGRPRSDTLAALVRLGARESADELAAIVRRGLAPRRVRAECAGALAALGDERGSAHLRGMLGAFRVGPRVEALAYIARFAVVACAADVAALVDRPRGLPLDAIAHTLERLETAEVARAALGRLDAQRNAS